MTYATETSNGFTSFAPGPPCPTVSARTIYAALVLAAGVFAGASWLDHHPARFFTTAERPSLSPPMVEARANATIAFDVALIDPGYHLGAAPAPLALSTPLGPAFATVPSATTPPPEETEIVLPAPAPAIPAVVQTVPLPAPRPAELTPRTIRPPFRSAARPTQRGRMPGPAAPADPRNFFEKLFGFGMAQPAGPVLAYAAPEDGVIGIGRGLSAGPVLPYDRWTAVYDIAAHTVYMPDGSHLEAHSGLRERLDDPRHVSERNRGATPPHVYDLELRPQLFHGVRALRLNPVGSGGVYGRTGLLAHTFMLGPNGDSNGCVSFRNYNAFLQAYQNGEVKRLAVVARMS